MLNIFFYWTSPYCLKQGLSLNLELTNWLAFLASQLQRHACLCLPACSVKGKHDLTQISHRRWGYELSPPSLHTKHITSKSSHQPLMLHSWNRSSSGCWISSSFADFSSSTESVTVSVSPFSLSSHPGSRQSVWVYIQYKANLDVSSEIQTHTFSLRLESVSRKLTRISKSSCSKTELENYASPPLPSLEVFT